jgi:hypothetical protein
LAIVKRPSTAILRSDYNSLIDYVGGESTNTSMFDTDLKMNTASTGLIVLTPDGTKRYRIRVDNSGNIVTELI